MADIRTEVLHRRATPAVFRCAAAGKLGVILTGAQMAAFKAVWAVEVPDMPDKRRLDGRYLVCAARHEASRE